MSKKVKLTWIAVLLAIVFSCDQKNKTDNDIIGGNNTEKATQDSVSFGPYVQNMTHRTAVVCWSTKVGESTFTLPDGSSVTVPEYEQHKMKMNRLLSNTTYSYNVLGGDGPEGAGSFTTFPDSIVPFNFAVLGDTRSRHDVHSQIVGGIMSKKPLLVVNTGDLVGDGNNILDWESFFKVNRELMRNTPYFPVLGNHEKDSEYYFDFFDLPGNERYYEFSIGDVLFIMLDSEGANYPTPDYIEDENLPHFWANKLKPYFEAQKKWVEHTLDLHKDAGFIFVFQHRPMYSIKQSRLEDAEEQRKLWGDVFERNNVQVFFSGHDHHYHHAIKNGTHYVTTAGGGAGLYEPDAPQPQTVKFSKIEHFVYVEVRDDEAELHVVDINGEEIDNIVVKKR